MVVSVATVLIRQPDMEDALTRSIVKARAALAVMLRALGHGKSFPAPFPRVPAGAKSGRTGEGWPAS